MTKTIDSIKDKRSVPEEVKAGVKVFNKDKKAILEALKESPKSIPQISGEINMPLDRVTYVLMTLRKFGVVETGELDDMDEYFNYKLTK